MSPGRVFQTRLPATVKAQWLATDWWKSNVWHQRTIGGQQSIMSVGWADRRQERVDLSTVGRTFVKFYLRESVLMTRSLFMWLML